jgi:hypothetical protein
LAEEATTVSEPALLRDVEPIRTLARLPLLTTSAAKAYRSCARLFFFSYDQGWRTLFEPPALGFGKLGHRGLEAWNLEAMRSPRDLPARLDAALDAMAAHPLDEYEMSRATALLTGYHARWADTDMEVLAVERQFATALLNPETGAPSRTWRLGGKIDAVVRFEGRVLVMEHKTSSEDISAGSDYRQRLILDSQVSNYLVGARALGFDVKGCLYDVIGKPGQRPSAVPILDIDGVKMVHDSSGQRVRTKDGKKWRESASAAEGYVLQTRPETADEYLDRIASAVAADPDRYFQRFPVVRLADEEREAAFDVWQVGSQIRESRRLRAWPRNPGNCKSYGRTCAYLEVCLGTASIDDPLRFRKAESVNEELEEEKKEQ